jgi:hypothetical protein
MPAGLLYRLTDRGTGSGGSRGGIGRLRGQRVRSRLLPAQPSMQIASVGRALPAHVYDQRSVFAALERMWAGEPAALRRAELFFERVRVERRHLALPLHEYAALTGFGREQRRLDPRRRSTSASRPCARPSTRPACAATSSTRCSRSASPASPRPVLRRAPDQPPRPLRPDLVRVPIFGLGCVAGCRRHLPPRRLAARLARQDRRRCSASSSAR